MTDLDRRTTLLLAAAIGTGAVAGILPAPAFATDAKGGEETPPNEDMMREHGVLRRILILYREVAPAVRSNAASIDAKAVHTAAKLFQQFGEQYHEEKLEETYVFPAVRKQGGEAGTLVDMLTQQHKRGREITGYVIDATRSGRIATASAEQLAQAMVAFARMYEAHAAYEDTIVFPAFRKTMSKSHYDELGQKFEAIERKQFGTDGFDMAVRKIAEAEAALGLRDLTKFTAQPPPPRVD